MADRIVLDRKHIPTYWPISFTAWSWLLMDRFQPPGWAWGVYWTLVVIIWIALSIALFTEKSVSPKELQ